MSNVLAQWTISPDLAAARTVREALAVELTKHHVSGKDYFLLACAELVVNLSRYPIPKADNVTVRLLSEAGYWSLEVIDDGGSFRHFSQAIRNDDPLQAAESGMGLKLLKSFFDDIHYIPACYRDDAMNVMLVRKRKEHQAVQQDVILIVDDDAVFRAVISAYLSPTYQILEAANVHQAYEILLRDKPDLVICDIHLPDADGTVLFDQLRHIPAIAKTAFIYLSGTTDPVKVEHIFARPVDDFIHKPVLKNELLHAVSKALLRRRYLADQTQREVVQKATLGLTPALPKRIANYNVALRSHAVEAGGGDFVLYHNGHLVMADLMGHGLQAKYYVHALAGYLRGMCSLLATQINGAAHLLGLLSEGFDADPVLSETLATLMVLHFNEDGTLSLANAGHPKPILINATEVKSLDIAGSLPGLGVHSYQEFSIILTSGERLLLFTDGFLDAGQPLDEAVVEVLKHCQALPIEDAADTLISFYSAHQEVEDDCTLILLECSDVTSV